MKRYLLYAAAYGLVGVVIGLGMAYYTKDVVNASVLLNPNGTPRVVPDTVAEPNRAPSHTGAHSSPEHAREE